MVLFLIFIWTFLYIFYLRHPAFLWSAPLCVLFSITYHIWYKFFDLIFDSFNGNYSLINNQVTHDDQAVDLLMSQMKVTGVNSLNSFIWYHLGLILAIKADDLFQNKRKGGQNFLYSDVTNTGRHLDCGKDPTVECMLYLVPSCEETPYWYFWQKKPLPK